MTDPGPGPSGPGSPGPGRAASLGFQSPARQGHTAAAVDPMSTPGGPVSFRGGNRGELVPVLAADSEGRAGLTPPGAVPSMPKPLGPPRFGDGPPRPGNPAPPRPQPTGPVPHPPPPLVIGVGVPYDSLPPADERPFRDRVRPAS